MTKSSLSAAVSVFAAALLCVAGGSAQAAKIMKLGYAVAQGHAYDTFAGVFKEELEKRTGSSVKVKNFCCFKMGSEQEMFKKLQLGTLDATLIAQNNAGPFYPKIDLLVLPYILQDYEHAIKVVDGPVGRMIWQDMPKEAGVHVVSIVQVSFRQLYNTKTAIRSIDDFKPLKYRVPKNVVMVDTYRAFGSDPVPLAWSETLTAVQTGTVDGGDLPLDVFYAQKFYEVAKHIAMTAHFAMTSPFLVGDKFMQKLSEDEKQHVYAAAQMAAAISRKQILDNEAGIIAELKSRHGVELTYPDKQPFIEAAAKVQSTFATQRGGDYGKLIDEIKAAAK
ncbi:MAG: TRAP transporter substrate-binding protein [Gammaproteobacteria bacterium]